MGIKYPKNNTNLKHSPMADPESRGGCALRSQSKLLRPQRSCGKVMFFGGIFLLISKIIHLFSRPVIRDFIILNGYVEEASVVCGCDCSIAMAR